MACSTCGQLYRMACYADGPVLPKLCGCGGHVYHENINYGRTVQEVVMSCRSVQKQEPLKLL